MGINQDKKSRIQQIIELVDRINEPLQANRIVKELGVSLYDKKKAYCIKTTLASLVKLKILSKVKYPKIPSFYCKPEWVNRKKTIKKGISFNPYWKS